MIHKIMPIIVVWAVIANFWSVYLLVFSKKSTSKAHETLSKNNPVHSILTLLLLVYIALFLVMEYQEWRPISQEVANAILMASLALLATLNLVEWRRKTGSWQRLKEDK